MVMMPWGLFRFATVGNLGLSVEHTLVKVNDEYQTALRLTNLRILTLYTQLLSYSSYGPTDFYWYHDTNDGRLLSIFEYLPPTVTSSSNYITQSSAISWVNCPLSIIQCLNSTTNGASSKKLVDHPENATTVLQRHHCQVIRNLKKHINQIS